MINMNAFSQSIPIYTQYIVNPYIYNPAYAGLEGKSTIGLTYRKQWYGINDAPTTTNLVFHTPLFAGLNMGLNVTQDNYGIFKTSSALLSVGYTIGLGWNHYLSVGISGGAGFNNIDFTNINPADPAYGNVLENGTYLDGNAGVAYHIGNLNVGVSLPRMFQTETYPTQTFDTGTLGLIKNYIITADYMLYFADDNFAFQPYALYRSYDGYTPQVEGGGIIHIKNLLWVGGAYRQDFGIAGMAGLKVKGNFSFGYSYEIPAVKATNINKSSHEILLTISFGKKNKRSKKHATFLASKKPEKEKAKKKAVAKKEEPKEEETTVKPPAEQVNSEAIAAAVIVAAATNNDTKTEPVAVEEQPNPEPFQTTTPPPIEVIPPPKKDVQPIIVAKPTTTNTQKEAFRPAIVTKKGNHPFELDQGHYVVVGVFGVFENAVRYSDKAQSQGYNTEYGFSSDKGLFYVVIHYADDPEITRKKRDSLRKLKQFEKAWYLLVE